MKRILLVKVARFLGRLPFPFSLEYLRQFLPVLLKILCPHELELHCQFHCHTSLFKAILRTNRRERVIPVIAWRWQNPLAVKLLESL